MKLGKEKRGGKSCPKATILGETSKTHSDRMSRASTICAMQEGCNLPQPNSISFCLGERLILTGFNRCAPPHGVELLELLKRLPIPTFPTPPARPNQDLFSVVAIWWGGAKRHLIEEAMRLEQKRKQLKAKFETQFEKNSAQLANLQQGCASNDLRAIRLLMSILHVRHPLCGEF
jgi:hypothetical protein